MQNLATFRLNLEGVPAKDVGQVVKQVIKLLRGEQENICITVDALRLREVVIFFQAEDGILVLYVTGVQTCALPIWFLRSQPRIAPLASDKFGCATIRLGSKNSIAPRPSQRGQAPIGLLNENRRGSSSGSAYSQVGTGQAYLAEKRCSCPLSVSTTIARPSAWRSAVSSDSVRRCLASARARMRSTTTSTECLVFFARR